MCFTNVWGGLESWKGTGYSFLYVVKVINTGGPFNGESWLEF